MSGKRTRMGMDKEKQANISETFGKRKAGHKCSLQNSFIFQTKQFRNGSVGIEI